MTLADLLARAALRRPAADAVVEGATRLSYAELSTRATAAACGFAQLGVARGDRVLIALRNRAEHVVAYWALQTLGAVPTPVNFRFAPGEMRYVLIPTLFHELVHAPERSRARTSPPSASSPTPALPCSAPSPRPA